MKKAFENYTLITGSHGKSGSLWKGPDHLLVVEGRGFILAFSEFYKRIDYKNIQAFTVIGTSRWIWLSILFLALAALFAGVALVISMNSPQVGYWFFLPCLPLLILLIVNLARGKTCRCGLQTAVQTLQLRPITRMQKSEVVLAELVQLCRLHQGELSAPPEGSDLTSSFVTHQATGKPMWLGSKWVVASGILTIMWGLVLMAELFVPGMPFYVLNCVLSGGVFITVLISLVHAMRKQSPGGLLFSLWSTLGLQLLLGLGLYVLAIILVVRETENSGQAAASYDATEKIFESFANLSIGETGPWGYLIVGVGAIFLVLGLFLLITGKGRGSYGSSNMPPPPIKDTVEPSANQPS